MDTETGTCRGEMDCKTIGINAPAQLGTGRAERERVKMQNYCAYSHLHANPESRNSEVYKYLDIDAVFIILALYTTAMDLR